MSKKSQVTELEVKAAMALMEQGWSQRKAAKHLGIPRSSLQDALKTSAKGSTSDVQGVGSTPLQGGHVKPLESDDGPFVKTCHNYGKSKSGRKHLVIPDTQMKPGISTEYLRWIGEYICDKRPDVVVHLGDHADMPSLSSYDKGKRSAEGKRVQKDIDAAIDGMKALLTPLRNLQKEQEAKGEAVYTPRLVFTLGNHCERIMRHVNANPELHGFLSYDNLRYKEFGWEVYDYLTPVSVDGVTYIHFMPNPMTGKPFSGMVANTLKTVGESFTQGHKQTLEVHTRFLPFSGKQQWGIVAGSCLEENHKVLTADLRYVRLGDVEVGQKLLSFEEEVVDRRSRRYQEGEVLAVKKSKKETFRVTLESGKSFIVTDDHRWFVKTGSMYRWVETNKLRKGTCIPKLLPEWEADSSFDGGWLAGMYDGEGCLSTRKTTGGECFQLSITQKIGPVLEKIKSVLEDKFGYSNTTTTRVDDVVALRIKGGVPKILKVLGSIRPIRLLNKFSPNAMGRICCPDSNNDKVVSIENAGENTIVEIEIDKKTMIVEGYGHHNCYVHDEDYKGVTGNKHWRGIILKHGVKDGSYDPCFVSLDYLKKRYGG